jgi:hypothetical protein
MSGNLSKVSIQVVMHRCLAFFILEFISLPIQGPGGACASEGKEIQPNRRIIFQYPLRDNKYNPSFTLRIISSIT